MASGAPMLSAGMWLRYELFRGRLSPLQFQFSEQRLGEFIVAHGNRKKHLVRMVDGERGITEATSGDNRKTTSGEFLLYDGYRPPDRSRLLKDKV